MMNSFNCKIHPTVLWAGTFLFWGAPLWLIYFYVTRSHYFNTHIAAFMELFALQASALVLPYGIGNLVVEIKHESSELIFRSHGRLPLIPYGPKAWEVHIPTGSNFEWRRPILMAKNVGGKDYHFKLANRINKKRLASWFEQNGISKPIGC